MAKRKAIIRYLGPARILRMLAKPSGASYEFRRGQEAKIAAEDWEWFLSRLGFQAVKAPPPEMKKEPEPEVPIRRRKTKDATPVVVDGSEA